MRLRWTTPAANDLYIIVRHIQKLPLPRKWLRPCTMVAPLFATFLVAGGLAELTALESWFSRAYRTQLYTKSRIRLWRSCVFTTAHRAGPEILEAT